MKRKTDKASRKMEFGSLKNGNPSGDFTKAARCGAKTRRGTGCQAPAMPNGRCRLHGGLSTGPKTAEGIDRIRTAVTKHGRYSAATKLRREEYLQVLLGPHFKGKLELLDSLRVPTGAENSPTGLHLGSSAAPTDAEPGSPVATAADDAKALTGLDSTRLASSRSWQWNPSTETAVSLVAQGRLSIREIAKRVGVSEKTIDRWKQRPAFRARVDEIVANFRNQLIAESRARLDEWLARFG
jgi:DNA-directed RNA polymerase specialized sigma24 family protein